MPPAFVHPGTFMRLTSALPYASKTIPAVKCIQSSASRNTDEGACAVVVGASRGIGLAITQALFQRFKGRIVGCCRTPDEAATLQALWQLAPDRVQIVQCDITQQSSVRKASDVINSFSDGRVDLLVNTAGFLHHKAKGELPEKRIGSFDPDFYIKNALVNTVGPALLAKYFTPLMCTRARHSEKKFPVFASITARVGSIEDNQIGGWYSYRMSKAAHNQFLRTLSREKRGICTVALHPGTVDTDLSAPFQANVKPEKLFPVDLAAAQLLDIIDSLEIEMDNGKFFAWDRQEIPW